METLTATFPVFTRNPHFLATKSPTHRRASVKPPPPEFDYRAEIGGGSRAAIAQTYPQLFDLADKGSVVLVQRSRFGPVPAWRADFVEPEAICLVGTTHLSAESAAEVERVVRAVKPENVVVELCKSRAGIMYISSDTELKKQSRLNLFSLSGTGFLGAVGRSINLGGQTALALRLLLAIFSSRVSSAIDRPFGDEFRAARRTSEEVGAQIVLGDRPIEITLDRAWNALGWTQKLRLLMSIFRGIVSTSEISEENLKESSSGDGIFQLYEQLSFSYPSLLQPLIHERDTYLAWSLKRSKAVNKSRTVVGVIGKGHMNGVIYALVSDQGSLRFRDIAGKRPSSGSSGGFVDNLLKSLLRDTVISIFLWVLYDQIKNAF